MASYVSGARWRKASRSNGTGGACLEVAWPGDRAALRDSKNPEGGYITVARHQFAALVGMAKDGKLDI